MSEQRTSKELFTRCNASPELMRKIRDAFEAERDSRKNWRREDRDDWEYFSPHVRDAWFNFRDGWLASMNAGSSPEPPAEQTSVTEIIRQMRGRAADSEGGTTIEVLLSDLRSVVTGMQLAGPSQPSGDDERREWGYVQRTLVQCQEYLQKDGVHHTWIDSAIDIAAARARPTKSACIKCGSSPLATERGRCEECGAYQSALGEGADS